MFFPNVQQYVACAHNQSFHVKRDVFGVFKSILPGNKTYLQIKLPFTLSATHLQLFLRPPSTIISRQPSHASNQSTSLNLFSRHHYLLSLQAWRQSGGDNAATLRLENRYWQSFLIILRWPYKLNSDFWPLLRGEKHYQAGHFSKNISKQLWNSYIWKPAQNRFSRQSVVKVTLCDILIFSISHTFLPINTHFCLVGVHNRGDPIDSNVYNHLKTFILAWKNVIC